jgi:SRSO17 transposase
VEGLAKAAGHREEPLEDSCRGLLLPGERKSVEPMAARLHPERVQAAPPVLASSGGQSSLER